MVEPVVSLPSGRSLLKRPRALRSWPNLQALSYHNPLDCSELLEVPTSKVRSTAICIEIAFWQERQSAYFGDALLGPMTSYAMPVSNVDNN
jgi:hypothetical protein